MYATNIKLFIYFQKTNNVFVFFLHYIPYKELKVGKTFKIIGKSFFKFSSYSHLEIREFQGVTSQGELICSLRRRRRARPAAPPPRST
jgi:hypothetical protein